MGFKFNFNPTFLSACSASSPREKEGLACKNCKKSLLVKDLFQKALLVLLYLRKHNKMFLQQLKCKFIIGKKKKYIYTYTYISFWNLITSLQLKKKSLVEILCDFVVCLLLQVNNFSYTFCYWWGDQTVGSVLIKYCLMWTRVSWRHGEKWEEIAAQPRKEKKATSTENTIL